MKTIFESGSFSSYKNYVTMDSARGFISETSRAYDKRITVFISHKHEDLEDLKGLIGFLESKYGVRAYIDSRDPSMPEKTTEETAKNIKNRIQQCDRFILLATNRAVESKWCNWELGYGDAQKYSKNSIAIFPVKPSLSYDSAYKGHEYLRIYPHIAYCDGTERYVTGMYVQKGYYVITYDTKGTTCIVSLRQWLEKSTWR